MISTNRSLNQRVYTKLLLVKLLETSMQIIIEIGCENGAKMGLKLIGLFVTKYEKAPYMMMEQLWQNFPLNFQISSL